MLPALRLFQQFDFSVLFRVYLSSSVVISIFMREVSSEYLWYVFFWLVLLLSFNKEQSRSFAGCSICSKFLYLRSRCAVYNHLSTQLMLFHFIFVFSCRKHIQCFFFVYNLGYYPLHLIQIKFIPRTYMLFLQSFHLHSGGFHVLAHKPCHEEVHSARRLEFGRK